MKESQIFEKEMLNIIASNINNIIEINNKYKHLGYNIYLKNNGFEIVYKKKKYILSIKKENNIFYWHLEPYNGSYYETIINDTSNSLDMVICAINENEKLYTEGD